MKTIKILFSISMIITLFLSCKKDEESKEDDNNPSAIIDIPDANLKDNLVHYNNPVIDENKDGEIQVSEALKIKVLSITNCGISNVKGLEFFTNLEQLDLSSNDFTTIDVSSLLKLEILDVSNCEVSSLDISKNTQLNYLRCFGCANLSDCTYPENGGVIEHINYCQTGFSSLDVSKLSHLKYIACRNMTVTQFDFSANHDLEQVWADNNQNLTKVNVKTGDIDLLETLEVFDCPNLTTICVDDLAAANAKDPADWIKDTTAHYSDTCN